MNATNGVARLKHFHLNSKNRQVQQITTSLERFHEQSEQLLSYVKNQEILYNVFDCQHHAYPASAKDAAARYTKLMASAQELHQQRASIAEDIELLHIEIKKMCNQDCDQTSATN